MSNFWISFGIGLLIVFGALALAVPGVLLSLRAKRPAAAPSNQTTTTTTTNATSSTNSSSSIIKSGLLGWVQLILITAAVLLVLNTWVIPGKIRAFFETIVGNIQWPTFSWSEYLPTSLTWTGWIVGLAVGAILWMAGEDILPGKLGKFSKAIAVALVALMVLNTPTEVYRFLVGSRPRLVATQGTTGMPKLQTDAFLDNVPGRFPVMTIAAGSRLGPVNDYDNSCLDVSQAGGTGKLIIYTRPDFTSEPVRAAYNPDYTLTLGHKGAAYQYFYYAEGGTVVLNLKRQDGDMSC